MAGLRNICRMYGSMRVNDVTWVWDYAADEPVKQEEMPFGSDRWKASELRKVELLREQGNHP